MNARKLLVLLSAIGLIVTLFALTFFSGCASTSSPTASSPAVKPATTAATTPAATTAKPAAVKIKAVQFVAKGNPTGERFKLVIDEINKEAKGEFVIEVVGGPEVTAEREQPEAVRSGAIDIGFFPTSYYTKIVPKAVVSQVSRADWKPERDNGFYTWMNEVHNAAGLVFISKGGSDMGYHMYATTKIDTVAKLKGLRFRTSPSYPFFKDLGITPVTMELGDVYGALERKMVDGLATKNASFYDQAMVEVCKYIIGPEFWKFGGTSVVMNLAAFNKLSKTAQDAIHKGALNAEPIVQAQANATDIDVWNKLKAKGGEEVKWSAEDTKYFLELIDKVAWTAYGAAFTDPAEMAKVQKMMGY